MSHTDKIKDCDAFFEVDPITRQIKNMTPKKIIIMQGDHNSERFTFSLPRYIEGHDMSKCSNAKIHYINPSRETQGTYIAKDLRISPDDEEKVILCWLVSGNVTKNSGKISFLVEFECFENDVLEYCWHTAPYNEISIGETFACEEEVFEQYADILEQWKQNLFGLSDAGIKNIETTTEKSISDIDTAKENAKTEIESTKNNALDEIENKGKETLETIPDDYTTLSGKIDSIKAECEDLKIVNTAKGSLISLSDSAEAPLQGMRIFGKTKQATTTGKNKLPLPYQEGSVNSRWGVAITVNDDGSVLLNGTSTASQVTNFYLHFANKITLPAGSYKCGGVASSDCYMVVYDPTIAQYRTTQAQEIISLTLTEESQIAIAIQWSANAVLNNVHVKPFIVEADKYDGNWEPYTGGMPSPNPSYPQALESVGDDGSVEQFVKGKNLLPYPYARTTMTTNGITFTDNGDGSITVNGTSTGFSIMELAKSFNFIHGMKYRLSGSSLNVIFISYIDKTGATRFYSNTATADFVWDNAYTLKTVYAQYSTAQGTVNETIYPMLYCTGYDNTYEPYKSQSLTIPTPNGLPGIPVSSGGNYTDENGQQYVSDYKDYERMVYVQRVGEYRNTGEAMNMASCALSPDGKRIYWNTIIKDACYLAPALSSHFKESAYGVETQDYAVKFQYNNYCYFSMPITATEYGTTYATYREAVNAWLAKTFSDDNPLIVKYQLATPIETPLTEEEIASYKALHTNYPNTTIYNDDGAYTEVKYVADTKNYVDNKIATEVAKLTAAIITE